MSTLLANWTIALEIWIALAFPIALLIGAIIHRGRQ